MAFMGLLMAGSGREAGCEDNVQRVAAGALSFVSMSPAISVVIPTYQCGRYVGRAVDSVLQQTFTDFELIVIDDGSTDGTGEALARYGGCIRYAWQPNRGAAAARNAGIRLCRGAAVTFLDADNWWRSDHLAVLTEALARHPEAVLASTCPRSHLAGRQRTRDARLFDALPLTLIDHVAGLHSCLAVRREHLLAIGGFNEALPVAEDVELCLRLAARGPFSFVQRRTIVRQHTRGSLEQRGGERGDYLPSLEAIARVGIEEVQQLARPDRAELLVRAEGKVRYVAALRALARDDEDGVAVALRDACRLMPELSQEGALVARRLELLAPRRAVRARHFSTFARLWPDPSAETALYLRERAITTSVLAGRPFDALKLAATRRWFARPAQLLRTFPLWARLGRRTVQRLMHRGRVHAG
jgi:Glycosyl transferase family 2